MKTVRYVAKMGSWVQNLNYPITRNFDKKATAIAYIKRALKIYPYVKIYLIKITKGNVTSTETWKTVRNKRGGLAIRKVK